MLYLPITKTWIISKPAKITYFMCALMACMLFGALFAIVLAMEFSGVQSLASVPLVLGIAKASLLPGVIGAAILTIAMWYFWFSFDKSSWFKKALWFLPLYFLAPIGPAIYCFFVYLPSPQLAQFVIGRSSAKALSWPEKVS